MKRVVVYRIDENIADKFEQLCSILGKNEYDVIQSLMYNYVEESNYKLNEDFYDDFILGEDDKD